ncbi:hypothetical protein BHE74_00028994 [Ensete ventricosum]|nr:hypothetical protein BHE74_00028994 [Ensete ventricosum]
MGTGAAVVWQEAVARRRGLVSRQGWRSREDKAREDVIHSPAKSLTARFESGGNLLPATPVTSSCPRTIGPPTWPTRHGEAGLTRAWRGQRSYDRPNTGKVGKVDIPQLQVRASPQGPRTAW